MELWRSRWRIDEPGIESTHVVVALHTTIHDSRISLLSYPFFCRFLVDPIRITPHIRINFAKFHRATSMVHHGFFKRHVELGVVEENIWIMKPAIEMPLYRLYGLNHTGQFLIASQDDQDSICSWAICLRLEASCNKDFVVFLANFPTSGQQSFECAHHGAYTLWQVALLQAS